MALTLFLHFVVSFVATICFAVIFNVPQKEYVFCGLTGGVGWLVYQAALLIPASTVTASLLSALTLALMSRSLAVRRKQPITVFLISGIFPLVPGAGIYYTAYYFIMNDNDTAVRYGVETAKCAVAIALGIVLMLSLPYQWFKFLRRRTPAPLRGRRS